MGVVLNTVEKFDRHAEVGGTPTLPAHNLRWYIDNQLEEMKRFRDFIGITNRLNTCLRLREGQYDTAQLQAIRQFGGSEVFARLTTNKIRGAAAMLRSIFVQGDRAWDIAPTPVPTLPEDITANIEQLVTSEARTLAQNGQVVDIGAVRQRIDQLKKAALEVARKQARKDAIEATRYIDDIFVEGGYYQALNEFILDFCTFPYAVLCGPTAVMRTGVDYVNGEPQRVRRPVLTFRRVDPYYIMWSPGAPSFEQANAIIERQPMSRADLNALIGLEGYDEEAVRSAIRDYGDQGYTYRQFFEAVHEEAQNQNSYFYSTNIDVLAFTGRLSGAQLKEFKLPALDTGEYDDDLEYQVQAWVCGEYVLKAQVDPDPSNRPNYYSAAYEPVPGSIPGTALCELFADVQEVYNATLRALVNNVAMASGPQVGLNRERWVAPAGGQVRIVPWQIWQYDSDPAAPAGEKPIEFFQPDLHAQELMATLTFLQNMADEISSIPRYLTGSGSIGGAGRTSSGLSMLMSNATRTMTSVAAGIDERVLEPSIRKTYDLVLLTTGTEILRGDEQIRARGATYVEQRETDRMRGIEFLNATMNPVDMQIMGPVGRASILRKISETFMGDEEVIPSEDEIMAQMEAAKRQAAMQAAAKGPNDGEDADLPSGVSRGTSPKPEEQRDPRNEAARGTDNMHRTRSQSAISRGM